MEAEAAAGGGARRQRHAALLPGALHYASVPRLPASGSHTGK